MGGIRGCFEHALPQMAEEGAVLSYLYPFSTAFYRKFGYELGCRANWWKIALRSVPGQAVGGTVRLLERGAELREAIERIDRSREARYNCMVRCEEIEYMWLGQANPFADRSYTYVYFRSSGEPAAYLTCRTVTDEGERTLECTRFVFDGLEGLQGLLALLKTMESSHSHALITLPEDVELAACCRNGALAMQDARGHGWAWRAWSTCGGRWSSPECGARAASCWRSTMRRFRRTAGASGCALRRGSPTPSIGRRSRRTSYWAYRISAA